MSKWHPERAELEQFLDGGMAAGTSGAFQRHLVVCRPCEERLTRLLVAQEGAEGPGADDAAGAEQGPPRGLLTAWRSVLHDRRMAIQSERLEAQQLWRELRQLGSREIGHRIATDPRLRSRALCELLIENARRTVLTEPRKGEEVVRLALHLAERLDIQVYGPGAVEAIQARAWAALGNCLRILADFRQAEQAFQMAEVYLSQSWLDPLDEGLLLEPKGSLRRAQRRFDESIRLFDEAIALYREIGEAHLHGRTLMLKGLALQYKGDLPEAAECYRLSLGLLDEHEEPRLLVLSQVNLIFCLFESGQPLAAQALIPEARRQMEVAGTRSDLLRLRWIEARIAAALEQPAKAEEAFLEIKDAFIADRLAFDAALVSLDLAALYARQGRSADVKRLAQEILPIFRSCEVPQEALAALIVFKKAAEMEQLTLGLVEEVSMVLRRVQPV